MPKRKCKFTEELRAKYPCFRVGRERWEAECLVCREGTYVSVANKGSLDLEAHVQSRKHKRNVGAAPEPPGRFQPFRDASQGTLAFPLLRECCDPDPDPIPLKTEAPADVPYGDPLDGIPFCGVAFGAGAAGTPFPMRIRYFDWKRGGLQTRTLALEPEPAWDILERRGFAGKCVAVVGDGRNLMLGGAGLPEPPECDVPGARKPLRGALLAAECPARILSNCIQHGADGLELDVQSVLWKIYAYVSAYSVRAEPLGDFAGFAAREYGRLQRHGRAPWLPLLPAIPRLLQAFPALRSFFLSLRSAPVSIRSFLEDEFSEIYVQHLASQAALFHSHLRLLAREDNSLSEVLGVLGSLRRSLRERRAHNFMSLRVKELLAEQRDAGREERADSFCRHVRSLYVALGEYLEAQTGSWEALACFRWMQLRTPPAWEDVEGCIKFLAERGIAVDDGKCFDEFCHLLAFLRDAGSDFGALPTVQKWVRFLGSARAPAGHPELLRMAQVFFAVPACGADFSKEMLES